MLIYRHISRQEFTLRWLFLCPFFFAIVFTLVPPVGFFGYFLVFIAYSFYRNRNIRHLLNIFYGLYPVVMESLIGRLLAFYVFPMLGIVLVHETSVSWYDALLELLVFPVYLGLTKLLKLDFTDLKVGFQRQYFNRFLLPMDLSMFVYLLSVVGLVVFEDIIPHADALRKQLNSIYLILFFMMLLYFNAVSKERLKQEILEQKDRQLQELATYSQHVEMLYGEIRAFRHDYLNILTSLKLSIEHEDLKGIREVYENVLRESGQQFYDSKFDIAKLSHIENPAVKSVLSAKLLEAQNKGIGISVEIDEPVRDLFIEVLDFITFLSILCDNAIDPSKAIQFAPKDDFVNRYYGASGISYFPGTGTDYPVKPGQTIIVAKYAIDHKAQFESELEGEDLSMYGGLDAFLDLRKADFEWTNINYDSGKKNNPDVPDLNAILTVTDASGNVGPEHEFSNVSESNGIALIKLPWTPEEFKKNLTDTKDGKGYLHYITVTSSSFGDFYAIEIPFENVIDCITICPRRMFQMRPSKLDRGYNAVTDVSFAGLKQSDYPIYSGLSLQRKWDGKKFVDDNNTTADFEVKRASLSRKK